MSESPAYLIAQRDELVQRLNDGDQRIKLGRRNGTDTSKWETGWIRLLRDYEQICQSIESLGSDDRRAA